MNRMGWNNSRSNTLFNAGLWSWYQNFSCWQDTSSSGNTCWEPQINHVVKSWCSLAMFALWCSALGAGVTSWQKWYQHVRMEEDEQTALWLPPYLGVVKRLWRDGWGLLFFSLPFEFSCHLADQFSSFLHFRISDQWKMLFSAFSYWYDFVVLVSMLFLSGKRMVKKQFLFVNWEEAVFPLLIWLWPVHWNLPSDMEMSLSLHAWMRARWGFLVWACFVCFPQKLCVDSGQLLLIQSLDIVFVAN